MVSLKSVVLFLFPAVALAAPAVLPSPEQRPGLFVPARKPNATEDHPLPNKFIVTLKSGLAKRDLDSHIEWVDSVHRRRDLDAAPMSGIEKQFRLTTWHGYVGEFDSKTIKTIKANPDVVAVEPDRIWYISAFNTQNPAAWGLGTASHRTQSTAYTYNTQAGQFSYAYIVDTGVNAQHTEFGNSRATLGYNAVAGANSSDNVGHGTHVAGTIAGRTYGVARLANVVAVKVFDTESSSTSTIMDGFQWAVSDIVAKKRTRKAVINMSLGGTKSDAFNSLVNNAAAQNAIVTVVAAGNNADNASLYSPASAAGAITVGAIASDWSVAAFSNYGESIDIFAPGVGVVSAYVGSPTALASMSGTSMATPHVAGLVLYLLSTENIASGIAPITSRLLSLATAGKVTGLTGKKATSANRILFNNARP